MANLKLTGLSSLRCSNPFTGQTCLPPKSPTPIAKPPSCHNSNPDDGSSSSLLHMPRSSSVKILLEEQPSWLDNLLNEPEAPPANKVVHRRSSSDPFTYFNANIKAKEQIHCNENPSWGFQSQVTGYHEELLQDPSNITSGKPRDASQEKEGSNSSNSLWNSPSLNSSTFSSGIVPQKEDAVSNISGLLFSRHLDPNMVLSTETEMQIQVESSSHATEGSGGGSESCQNEPSANSDSHSKRVKQNHARRSQVRKLRYITELERRIQALQAEGSEVWAELKFVDQQNLILGMENRALKQHLDNLLQVQHIKSFEQDILEREIGRLQFLYHQQLHLQQQQHHHPVHHRVGRWDIES